MVRVDAVSVRAWSVHDMKPWWAPGWLDWHQEQHPVLDADGHPARWQFNEFRLEVEIEVEGKFYGAAYLVNKCQYEHVDAVRDVLLQKCHEDADASL